MLFIGAACLTLAVARGERETASMVETSPAWQVTETAQFTAGYSDNLMLSPFAPLAGAFGEAGAEALLLGSIRPGWELSAFVQGNHRHYQHPDPEVRDESGWFSRLESRWQPQQRLSLSLVLAAFGENSISDLSETEASRLVIPARLRGGSAGLSTRLDLSARVALRLSARRMRTDYLNLSGDHDGLEQRAQVEWLVSPRLTAGVEWKELRRDYADRPQYTAGGRPLNGTRLSFWRAGGEASLTLQLDTDGRQRLTLTAGESMNRDRSSGYFNVNQRHAGLRFHWSAGRWDVTCEGLLRQENYSVQTGGTGIAPPLRHSRQLQAGLHAERMLTRHWSAIATVDHDHDRGNLAEFTYAANTAGIGLKCTF